MLSSLRLNFNITLYALYVKKTVIVHLYVDLLLKIYQWQNYLLTSQLGSWEEKNNCFIIMSNTLQQWTEPWQYYQFWMFCHCDLFLSLITGHEVLRASLPVHLSSFHNQLLITKKIVNKTPDVACKGTAILCIKWVAVKVLGVSTGSRRHWNWNWIWKQMTHLIIKSLGQSKFTICELIHHLGLKLNLYINHQLII